MAVKIIATIPLYGQHRTAVIGHSSVSSVRFNTITPVAETRREVLAGLFAECGGKPLWLDYKTRQLRVIEDSDDPAAPVKLSHAVRVITPVEVLFKDFRITADRVVKNELFIRGCPPRGVKSGEAINILAPSLAIDGFFTPSDEEYLAAAVSLGIHTHMLSFVEQASDIEETLERDPQANVVAKIESRRGLEFVRTAYSQYQGRVRLMAAMDDLYINMGRKKLEMLPALRLIVNADPEAIAASRILTSLENDDFASFQDLTSLLSLAEMGFRTIMLSDRLCADPFGSGAALNLLKEMNEKGLI